MCNSFSARGLFFIASRVLSLQLNMFQSSGLPSDLRALPQIKKANATSSFSLLLKRFLNAVNEIFRIARSNSWRWNFRWTKQFFICLASYTASECVSHGKLWIFVVSPCLWMFYHFAFLEWWFSAERVVCEEIPDKNFVAILSFLETILPAFWWSPFLPGFDIY